jgi:NTP pyrophosphatase (non-canonical NTP hydrolase)
MNELKELTEQVAKFQSDREWDKGREPKDDAIDIIVEASEIVEHFQWKKGDELKEYVATHKEEISDEMADVLFGLLSLGNVLRVDLGEAFAKKMKDNEQKYPVAKAKGNHKKYTEF